MLAKPRLKLSLALIFLTLLLPTAALGQSDFSLAQLTVALWPEFDQPEVLVIYQAELPASAELPALVELPLPAGIGSPHAVANALETGELVNAEYDIVPAESGQVIQITAETRTIWLEYYAGLSYDGATRSFSYQWPGTMAVAQFNFEVQQPIGAQSVELQPSAQGQRVGSDGLTYLTGSFGALSQGEAVSLDLTYQKSTDELSASQVSQQPSGGISLEPPQDQAAADWLVPALVGLVAAVLVAAGYFLWQRRRSGQRSGRRRRRARPRKQPGEARYCHNCGQGVGANDRYCRNCGAELRGS